MPANPVRVAVYGTGRFAQATHLPNLSRIDGVEIAALCDINEDALREAAAQFGVSRTYADAHEMLETENPDALWSIVPAFARTDVEIAAAANEAYNSSARSPRPWKWPLRSGSTRP